MHVTLLQERVQLCDDVFISLCHFIMECRGMLFNVEFEGI
jgi:hypothetical protein